jgi:hypothetical protein
VSASTLNTAGLCLDIVGAFLLLVFGVSGGPAKGGVNYLITEQSDPAEEAAYRRHWRTSRFGFLLIIIGSGLQIWSNYR